MKKKHTGRDDMRNLIDEIARRKLPDGVIGGIIAGRESEIRQNAASMLKQGFLLGNLDFAKAAERRDQSATLHLERGVAIALKRCKARLMRKRIKEIFPPG